MLGNIL